MNRRGFVARLVLAGAVTAAGFRLAEGPGTRTGPMFEHTVESMNYSEQTGVMMRNLETGKRHAMRFMRTRDEALNERMLGHCLNELQRVLT